jgi:hypothetical protein
LPGEEMDSCRFVHALGADERTSEEDHPMRA